MLNKDEIVYKKFLTGDKVYLAKRKELAQKYGMRDMWFLIDHWPLYVGIRNLARFLTIYELVKRTIGVPGHIAEFGSWRGANLMFMTKVLRIFDPHGFKVSYCFDSFEGLTEFHEKDAGAKEFKHFWKGSFEELIDMINLYELQDDIIIVKGYIEKTLPGFMKEKEALGLSLVFCDTDLYSSTKVILEQCHPRLSKGGLIVFDEWNREDYPGEGVAVHEFLREHGDCYESESVPQTRHPTMVLKKIKYD